MFADVCALIFSRIFDDAGSTKGEESSFKWKFFSSPPNVKKEAESSLCKFCLDWKHFPFYKSNLANWKLFGRLLGWISQWCFEQSFFFCLLHQHWRAQKSFWSFLNFAQIIWEIFSTEQRVLWNKKDSSGVSESFFFCSSKMDEAAKNFHPPNNGNFQQSFRCDAWKPRAL